MEKEFYIEDAVILTHEYKNGTYTLPRNMELHIVDCTMMQFNPQVPPTWYFRVAELSCVWIPEEWLSLAPVTWNPSEPITDQHDEQDDTEQLVHPSYYQDGIEPIDYIQSHGLSFNLGNVVKYVTRAGKKTQDALPDLQKALYYLQYEIKNTEEHRHE